MLNKAMFWSLSTETTSTSTPTQLVSLSNLISFFKMDGSLGRAQDIFGAHDGSLVAVVQNSAGKIGTSFSFNGTSSGVDCSTSGGAFDFGTSTDFSLCAWTKTTVAAEQMVISKFYTGVVPAFILEVEGSTAYAVIRDGTGSGTAEAVVVQSPLTGFINVCDNNWHYLVATFDRDASLTLYVDARKAGDASIFGVTGTINNGRALMIGRRDFVTTPFYFNGNIDEVAIWSRVLTQLDVSALYNNGYGLSYPFTSESSVGT